MARPLIEIERTIVDYFGELGFEAQTERGEFIVWPGNGGEISLTALAVAVDAALQKADPAELTRLRAEVERLTALLRPFAEMADQLDEWQKGTDPNFAGHFDADDLRAARAALAAGGNGE